MNNKRLARASEIISEHLIDNGIGAFVPVTTKDQPNHLYIVYPLGTETAMFGVPDVYDFLKEWLGGDIGMHEADDMRTLRIPVALILSKRGV